MNDNWQLWMVIKIADAVNWLQPCYVSTIQESPTDTVITPSAYPFCHYADN